MAKPGKANIYRLFSRLVLFLPVIWMIYALHELALNTYSADDQFENSPLNIDMHRDNNKDSQAFQIKTVDSDKQFQLNNQVIDIESIRELPNTKLSVESLDNSVNNMKDNFRILKHLDTKTVEDNKTRSEQLRKLTEIGGIVVEKKPQEFYANVALPHFNDKIDPNGPGENGIGVRTDISKLSKEDKVQYDKGWGANSFNQFASDQISVHRHLPDGRSMECTEQAKSYRLPMKQISVIIIFHNEAWSVLLRSVHSILSRTPEHILKEVIIVDDFSTQDYLKEPLEKYFNNFTKVQIVRATKRQGLTRARLLGYYLSTSPIVVFLDSHIECFPGWAEPLISRISEDPTRVVFPSIEVINDEELSINSNSNVNQNGIFIFKDLTFQWQTIPVDEMNRRKTVADPIRSPTMPGGLFAISREFFDRLGNYDPGLDYWGGENIELSFKAWMCGGSVEMVVCSHIGHIFRRTNPIHWMHSIGHKNSIRVAEVWMDDYKNYFYERILYNLGDFGDVTDRKQLRDRLKCHSFEWYLQNVFPNIQLPANIKYAGEIRSHASPRCVDTMGGLAQNQPSPKLYPCHGEGHNQFWYFSEAGEIYQDDGHICVSDGRIHSNYDCGSPGPTWKYQEDNTLLHITTNQCLTASVGTDDLYLSNCTGSIYQKWTLQQRRLDLKFPVLP